MANTKKSIIAFHLLGAIVFWLLPIAFMVGHLGTPAVYPVLSSVWYWSFIIFYTVVFYWHAYWLLPNLFYKSKKLWYTLIIMALLFVIGFCRPFDKIMSAVSQSMFGDIRQPAAPKFSVGPTNTPALVGRQNNELPFVRMLRPQFDIISYLIFIWLLGLGLAIHSSVRWRMEMEQMARAEADKVIAELKFLKAHVNPHFLFNSLNSIYSLALSKDNKTADSIMQLSNIMRYLTDEATKDFVLLSKEVECINSYIDLQALRFGRHADTTFQLEGKIDAQVIAPMILMGFIENAFKYGIGKHERSPISINLKVDENTIYFFCQNKIFKHLDCDKRIGTGLANIQKRLAYLYPLKNRLELFDTDATYTVKMTLNLIR